MPSFTLHTERMLSEAAKRVVYFEPDGKPFDAKDFKNESKKYVEDHKRADRSWKITWFSEKQKYFTTKLYPALSNYEREKSKTNLDALLTIIKQGESDFYGWGFNPSAMSKMLCKYRLRLETPVELREIKKHSAPSP